jgi:hypothetical protein
MVMATKRAMGRKRAKATATAWAMGMATRVAGNIEGSGKRHQSTKPRRWQ